jgi:hypothetical protein
MQNLPRSLVAVIALNAILLGGIALIGFAPASDAQAVRRSTFTMVSGTINGQVNPVLYIVDEGSLELVAISWDDQTKTFTGLGYRNLSTDAADLGRNRN